MLPFLCLQGRSWRCRMHYIRQGAIMILQSARKVLRLGVAPSIDIVSLTCSACSLVSSRLKLQQAEAAQGQQGGVSPVRRSSQSLPHQHQRRVAASPVNRRLLRHSSPSRAPACSPSPGRLQYKVGSSSHGPAVALRGRC